MVKVGKDRSISWEIVFTDFLGIFRTTFLGLAKLANHLQFVVHQGSLPLSLLCYIFLSLLKIL